MCKIFGLTQEELNRIMFYFSHFLIKISAKRAVGRALIRVYLVRKHKNRVI